MYMYNHINPLTAACLYVCVQYTCFKWNPTTACTRIHWYNASKYFLSIKYQDTVKEHSTLVIIAIGQISGWQLYISYYFTMSIILYQPESIIAMLYKYCTLLECHHFAYRHSSSHNVSMYVYGIDWSSHALHVLHCDE